MERLTIGAKSRQVFAGSSTVRLTGVSSSIGPSFGFDIGASGLAGVLR